jgi:nicotinate dehydrogenase subunit A
MVDLTINGKNLAVDEEPTAILLDVLRNRLGLVGARFGCGEGHCGACAVLVDGEDKASCMLEVGNLKGKKVETLEGIGSEEKPHPLQSTILELQAGQCGYCLSGMIVGAKGLLNRNPHPSRREVVEALNGHLCRCGIQLRIIEAVLLAAKRMREERA